MFYQVNYLSELLYNPDGTKIQKCFITCPVSSGRNNLSKQCIKIARANSTQAGKERLCILDKILKPLL